MPTPETLTAWTLAATVERSLVHLEAASGDSVHFASRPLTKDERAAKTRFGDLDSIVEVNTAGGFDLITGLYGAALGAILAEVFDDGVEEEGEEDDVVDMAVLTGTLAYLLSYRPPTYTRRAASAATDMSTLITRSYEGGVATVIAEARRQGIDTDGWDRPGIPGILTDLAGPIADHPFLRIVQRTLDEFRKPSRQLGGPITRADLGAFMEDTPQAGTLDQLHQANQAALGNGRNDAAANYTGDFIVAIASEILDQATCGPCAAIDGTRFTTLEEAQAAYPAGYVSCQGGSRCRGVCVYLYEDTRNDEDA